MQSQAAHFFDARGVAKRFRHAAIFGALESLNDGETMRFVNDHDPLPLIDQINQRYQGQITHRYVQRDDQAVVIDFSIDVSAKTSEPAAATPPAVAANSQVSGACGGGSGCGCSGG